MAEPRSPRRDETLDGLRETGATLLNVERRAMIGPFPNGKVWLVQEFPSVGALLETVLNSECIGKMSVADMLADKETRVYPSRRLRGHPGVA
jgi:hypothetical protein